MQETRRQRLQSVILEEVSRLVSRELKDPRVPAVTFTACEVTQDADQATLFVTLFGSMVNQDPNEIETSDTRRKMKECLEGLGSAQGFLRKNLGKILNVRHVPNLIFKEDKGLTNSTRVRELLQQIDSEKKKAPSDDANDTADSKG